MSSAIISSSFVGTIYTFILESGVEINLSSPLILLASLSIFIPKNSKYLHILSLASIPLSPTPPANAIISSPPNVTIYWPIYCATLYAWESSAKIERESPSAYAASISL